MVHGKQAASNATAVNAILFSDMDPRNVEPSALDLLAQEIPTARVPSGDGLSLVDAVVHAGLAKSKSEARRAIEHPDWLTGGNLLLRKGKKDYALLRAAS